MTEHLQMTASCAYPWILRNFSDQLFHRASLRNCFFHVAEFQPPDIMKSISLVVFKHFIQEREVVIQRRSFNFKLACRIKTNTTWTPKNTTSFHYFSQKIKSNTLQGRRKYIKIFELKYIIAYSNFCGKNDVILLKNSAFRELQVLIGLIFRYNV